jgi:hypothetical protein
MQSIHELQVDAAYRMPPWVIDHNSSHVGQGLQGVGCAWRNHRRRSGTNDPSLTVYGDFKLTSDDVPDLVVRMGVLMDPSTDLNGVIRERHVRRMKETPFPAFPGLLQGKSICVDERHNTNPLTGKMSYREWARGSLRIEGVDSCEAR